MKIAGSRKLGREVRFGGGEGGIMEARLLQETLVPFSLDMTVLGCERGRRPAVAPGHMESEAGGLGVPAQALQSTSFTLHFASSTLSTQKRKKTMTQSICHSPT